MFQVYQGSSKSLFKKSSNKNTHIYDDYSFCLLFFLFFFSEIEKFQGSDGKKEDEEKKYLDVISNKNIKLSERVLIPVKQYPKVLQYMLCSHGIKKKMINI